MQFSYQGFTHEDDRRCFRFRSIELDPVSVFSIEVDLPLLFRNRLPVQEGPMFCLQLLTAASLAGPGFLERFHKCRLVEADFRPLLMEREKRAAEKALRKPPRRPLRKPSPVSSIAWKSSKEHE